MRYTFLLCVLILAGPVVAADASWMLAYEGKSSRDLTADPSIGRLLQDGLPASLAASLRSALGGAPGEVLVSGKRYLSVSACVLQSCTPRAFLWVDTRSGVVLGAYAVGELGEDVYSYSLTLGSLDLTADDVPAAALRALRSWIYRQGLAIQSARFIARDGSTRVLDAATVAPAPQEPAYDCATRVSVIEKDLCAYDTLARLDRVLNISYQELLKGLNAHDQQQLRELQRQWLRGRNSRCGSAADALACLREECGRQLQALERWRIAHPAILLRQASIAGEPEARIKAVLVPVQAEQNVSFAMSADRRRIYATSVHEVGIGIGSGATLHIIDVADPAHPLPLAQVPLGDVSVSAIALAGERLFIGTYQHAAHGPGFFVEAVVIFDVSRPQAPTVVARGVTQEQTGLQAVGDGSCFLTGDLVLGELHGYVVTPDGHIEPGTCARPPTSTSMTQPTNGVVFDERGNDSLVDDPGLHWVLIRTTAGASSADRAVILAGEWVVDARFLETTDVVLAKVLDPVWSTTFLVVLDTARPALDVQRVRTVHAGLLRVEGQMKDGPQGRSHPLMAGALASRLGAAGVQQALDLSAEALRKNGLVPVLADWGRWQSRSTNAASAIATLQRVLEVEPARLEAWRNLGLAARRALLDNPDPAERLRLTRVALEAYAGYQKHGGRIEPDMADFLAFNASNAPQDVCQLVREYQRRGRFGEIVGVTRPADVQGSNRKLWLDVRYAGAPPLPSIVAEDADGHVLPQPFGGIGAAVDVAFVFSGGKAYAVFEDGHGPHSVSDWSGRELCRY